MANDDVLDMFYNLNEHLLTSFVPPPGQQSGYPGPGMLDHFACGLSKHFPKRRHNGPKGLLMANNDILDKLYNLNEQLLTSFVPPRRTISKSRTTRYVGSFYMVVIQALSQKEP